MSQLDLVSSDASGLPVAIKAPTVASVLPVSGAAAGGTPIVITGANFKKSAHPSVTCGGVACTAVVVLSATTIGCTTGAHDAAAGLPIVVTNAAGGDGGGGLSGTGAALYEYT